MKNLILSLLLLIGVGCSNDTIYTHGVHIERDRNLENLQKSSVLIKNHFARAGSGVVIYQDDRFAYVITCRHVVESVFIENLIDLTPNVYKTYESDSLPITPVGRNCEILVISDKDTDLALLRVNVGLHGRIPEVAKICNSPLPSLGSKVFIAGSPASIDNVVSAGFVSKYYDSKGRLNIKTTCPIVPGYSGGGLFNERHELVGIIQSWEQYSGINNSLAISDVKTWIKKTPYSFVLK